MTLVVLPFYHPYSYTSSTDIRQEDFKRLALVARIVRDNPKEKYFVVGYADSRGTIEHNADLAKRRAQSAINC